MVYLLCEHTARRNPHPTLDLEWSGLRDGKQVTFKLTDLVPLGDMHVDNKWTTDRCPFCFAEGVTKETFGQFKKFTCGHVVGEEPVILDSTQPEAVYRTEVVPVDPCLVCGASGGSYRLVQMPQGVMKCGHGYLKYPDKPAQRLRNGR